MKSHLQNFKIILIKNHNFCEMMKRMILRIKVNKVEYKGITIFKNHKTLILKLQL